LTVAFIALALERFLGFPSPLRKLIGHPIDWLYRFTGIFAVLVPGAEGSQARESWSWEARSHCSPLGNAGARQWRSRPGCARWATRGAGKRCWRCRSSSNMPPVYAPARWLLHWCATISSAATEAVHMLAPDAVPPGTEAQAVRRTVEAMAKRLVSDIITPVFWLALFGLPGIITIAALQAVLQRTGNDQSTSAVVRAVTHAARFLPGKLSGLLVTGAASLLSPSAGARALEHIHADARFDRVRDANWARAAFAGILKIRLAGPESPGQTQRTDHWIGNGTRDASLNDLRAALRLLATSLTLLTILTGLAAAFA
jgi:adenosylcobinamide-phosphate synthase